MKNFILVILILGGVLTSSAQVPTLMFEKSKAFEKHPKFKVSQNSSPEKKMPVFDLAPLLAEDEAVKGLDFPFRFGKSFDVNLTLTDGKWIKTDTAEIWSLKITSAKAYSLNFIFSELYLPEGAELYIFNDIGTMVYGPITAEQNQHGKNFLTDIIQSESAIFQLSMPNTTKDRPELTIQKVIHGYKNIFKGYGDSGSCLDDNDVACYFPTWEVETDGVVQILLSSGAELCSGSLINNTAQDYRPFILTAFHCIDLDQSGVLSAGEITIAEDWLVRFRFRHTTCGGSTFANVLTYDDTFFRAAWNTTDFALVELQDNIISDIYSIGQKVWLGWDRTTNNPSNGTSIHHPSGDVMKLSIDSDGLIPNPSSINISQRTYEADRFWRVQWNDGVTEGGSSGAPIFNSNRLIIGQLLGGGSSCSAPSLFDYYGRFNISWVGGGTNATRLSNWLQPTGSATTLNSVRQPTPAYSGIGGLLCSSSYVSVITLAPGYSIHHWNGSNVTFPNGNTGNPVLVSPGSSGQGWVQAVINTGGGQYTMSQKNLYIRELPTPVLSGNTTIKCGYQLTYRVDNVNQVNGTSFYWESDVLSISNASSPTCNVWGTFDGTGYISCTVTACGISKTTTRAVEVILCNFLLLSPNPATNETTVSIESSSDKGFDTSALWDLEVYEQGQILKIKKSDVKGKSIPLNTLGWKEGVYIIRANYNGELLTNKLVVKH